MSNFAKIDKQSNKVVDIINATQLHIFSLDDSEDWIQVSYNGNMHNKYPAIGDTFDRANNMFISPQPHSSWMLDYNTGIWKSPIPEPTDWDTLFSWDEDNLCWIKHYSSQDVIDEKVPQDYLNVVNKN